ncbi:unnamed protein product, partial [marine sediment metagenome]
TSDEKLAQQRRKYIDILQKQDIAEVTLGQTCRIILPDTVIFNAHSANLLSDQQDKLATVADLIKTNSIVEVDVAGYADDRLPEAQSRALTQGQAQAVADYLRRANIDARLIAGQGYGQHNVVASNVTAQGKDFNRRVEVTFRVYPDRPMY